MNCHTPLPHHHPTTLPALRTLMKFLAFMNGWRDAPHCWPYFLINPFRIERTPGWISISLLGFVWFFDAPFLHSNAHDA